MPETMTETDPLFGPPEPSAAEDRTWPPAGARLILSGTVLGEAKTAGSKVSGPAMRTDKKTGKKVPIWENGKLKTFTKEDDKSGAKAAWRGDVRSAVMEVFGEGEEPLDQPLALSVVFYRTRSKGHYGTGRNAGVLKDSAPAFPAVIPDGTKLLRAFEDALNKLVWRDDARITAAMWFKDFAPAPRADYFLYALPVRVADLRVTAPTLGDRLEAMPDTLL